MTPAVQISHSVPETREIASRLATLLRAGDVVVLRGDLGAGKTHFVQGVVAAFGVPEDLANSPTFVIIQEYDAAIPICHIDAYRVRDCDEFIELGADEILGSDTICLIEWGDRVAEVLPRDRLTVVMETLGETTRRISFVASGPRSTEIVDRLGTPGRD
jgi:tRNA threonylcarbamoyladenosine biosynthesis protein TsaE